MTHRTITEIGLDERVSPDLIRKIIRRVPELRALGQLVGPTRVYSAAETRQILVELRRRGKLSDREREEVTSASGG